MCFLHNFIYNLTVPSINIGIDVLLLINKLHILGPGIIFSFLIAALFVGLNAMCFVELAARVPRTGSTYLYVYCSLGEMWAFLTGWSILFCKLLCYFIYIF